MMRLRVATRRRALTGRLPLQCVRQERTSSSGRGLLRRYLRLVGVPARLAAA
jgi:hypothetical protein